jgi:hypothetical protein
MNQNILTYLNENKEKYPKEVLAAELRKAGYSEGDITEGVAQVFEGKAPVAVPTKTSFWNFKDKKVYTSAWQKWADFLFGFFAPILVGYALTPGIFFLLSGSRMPFVGVVFFLAEIAAAIYLFNRRRFIFYGMMGPMIILPLLVILFIVMMFGHMRF